MLLYGASGHAKVVIDTLKGLNQKVSFLFDDNSSNKKLLEYEVFAIYNPEINKNEEIIVTIGDNRTRKNVVNTIKHKFGIVISKNAIVSNYSIIEEGTVIFHGAIIQTSSYIGKHVIINTNSSIDHDCKIGDFVHISPGTSIAGGVSIGEGTQIGTGACIIPNIKIGKWCIIGAGCVVIKDIPDYSVVVGNPGRILKTIKY